MSNAVIYVRVSPTRKKTLKDEKTDTDLAYSVVKQLEKCRKYADAEGDKVVEEYVDEYKSGKALEYMLAFKRLLEDANSKKFEKIYCLRIDRFGRNLKDAVNSEEKLRNLGISIKFVEQSIDTSDKFGRMIFGILMSVAEWQRETIIENTRIGREAAMEKGIKFGRKKKVIDMDTATALQNQGWSYNKIAKKLGVSTQTIITRLKDKQRK